MTIGTALAHFRKQKGYTQQVLADISTVSKATIARAESGVSDPRQDNLKLLLEALEVTSVEFENYRQGLDHNSFNEVFNQAWDIASSGNMPLLKEKILEIKADTRFSMDTPSVAQGVLLLESIVLKEADKRYKDSISKLHQALEITAPVLVKNNDIVTRNIKAKPYGLQEYRILKQISVVLSEMKRDKETMAIELAVLESLEHIRTPYSIKKKLLPSSYFNLSNDLLHIEDYNAALEVINHGLDFCKSTGEIKFIGQLLSNKGLCLCELESLEIAIPFLKSGYQTLLLHDRIQQAARLQTSLLEDYNLDISFF